MNMKKGCLIWWWINWKLPQIKSTKINCILNLVYNKKKMKYRLYCYFVAPHGCLQYHTDLSGNIRSFNYDPADGGHYQSNLEYAICIQRSPNTCRVEFNQIENSVFWINSADGLSYNLKS